MRSFSLSPASAARRGLTAVALATITFTGACSDDATAPSTPAAVQPIAAQATILPLKTLVTVRIKDVWGSLITDKAPIRIGDFSTPYIWDNSSADWDGTTGIISVYVPRAATLHVCLGNDTQNFAIEAMESYCNDVPGNTSTVDAGSLVMHRYPKVSIALQDMNGNKVVGATLQISDLSQGFNKKAEDGYINDLDGLVNGNITVKLNRPGTYTWCETVAPTTPGTALANPSCGTFKASWDLYTYMVIKHPKKMVPIPI